MRLRMLLALMLASLVKTRPYLPVRAGNRKEFSGYYYVRDPGPTTCDLRSANFDLRPVTYGLDPPSEKLPCPSNEHPGSVKAVGVICSVIHSIVQVFLMLISVI